MNCSEHEHRSTRVHEHTSTRANEHTSTRAHEYRNTRTHEHVSMLARDPAREIRLNEEIVRLLTRDDFRSSLCARSLRKNE